MLHKKITLAWGEGLCSGTQTSHNFQLFSSVDFCVIAQTLEILCHLWVRLIKETQCQNKTGNKVNRNRKARKREHKTTLNTHKKNKTKNKS